ncbi:MAG: hypothetical protein EHM24_28830, partial [Acidobacteria bacterium]
MACQRDGAGTSGTMTLRPGTRLGPYEIGRALGAGGMGEVFEARDTRLDRLVAIKILQPGSLVGHEETRARFEREARVVASLSDPHICTLYDIGHQDGVDFLVMELLHGETLSDRLLRAPLGIPHVVTLAIQVARALDRAHRQGVVHRDLKPGNIMLTPAGAKLLDFGLARLLPRPGVAGDGVTIPASLTSDGTITGTIPYMAPEQLEGKPADARSDLFAFGAVVYEMTTGRRAFDGASQAALIGAILRSTPAPIHELRPDAPAALARVVTTCLEKDPEARWSSAHDIVLLLQDLRSEPAASAAGVLTLPGPAGGGSGSGAVATGHGEGGAPEIGDNPGLAVVEVIPDVTAEARALLLRHPLRAGDAIQLASCLYLQREPGQPVPFVAFDQRLLDAARAEGVTVVGTSSDRRGDIRKPTRRREGGSRRRPWKTPISRSRGGDRSAWGSADTRFSRRSSRRCTVRRCLLLRPQGFGWLNAQAATCRTKRRGEADAHHHQRDSRQQDRCVSTGQLPPCEVIDDPRNHESQEHAGRELPQRAGEHRAHDLARAGAKRRANTDLPPPL